MTTRFSRINLAREEVKRHRDWIDQCGGNLAGYLLRYGGPDDVRLCEPCLVKGSEDDCAVCAGTGYAVFCYGDGGRAIYNADIAALRQAEENLDALQRAVRREPPAN